MEPQDRRTKLRAHALRLDISSVAQGGLAFLLAFVAAYMMSA